MDSRALINETLKYLDKDENGKPKYRFEVYNKGATQTVNRMLDLFTAGTVQLDESEDEEPVPVSVYTIGDIFNTIKQTGSDVLSTISALPDTLENIKVSLKQLGFNALNTTIDTIKAAVVPIEVIQTVNDVYRIARPLVEKIVDIASIRFHFENAVKIAQDVLQYIGRLAVSTARNYLTRLFDILMETPVFAVYENDNTVNLSGAYSLLSDAASEALEKIAMTGFDGMINYANSMSSKRMYEPGYVSPGIAIPEDIVDVYSDPNTRRIFIASDNNIYSLNEDYSTTLLTTIENGGIEKLYFYNGSIYYIKGDEIFNIAEGTSFSITSPEIIYSNPLLIHGTIGGTYGIYNADGTTSGISVPGTVSYSAFDYDNNVLYLVNDSNHLYRVTKNVDGNFVTEKLTEIDDDVYGMAYFNNILYVIKETGGEYIVMKINAGMGFRKTDYVFSTTNAGNIIYTDGSLATDGTYIYSQDNENITSPKNTLGSINSITYKEYNNFKYYVATGGTKIYTTLINESSDGFNWFSRDIEGNYIKAEAGGEKDIPDNIAGCLWFSHTAFGDCFIAYSQTNVYLIGPDKIDQIFDVPMEEDHGKLCTKNFVSFHQWYVDSMYLYPDPTIECSDILELGDNGCIITNVRVINNELYISLYNPNETAIKTGIYKLVITHPTQSYSIDINTNEPIYIDKDSNKIYSFNLINSNWYFTDGHSLFNATTNSMTDLKLGSTDNAINVFDNIVGNDHKVRIFTSKAVLDEDPTHSLGEISSFVNYKSTTGLSVASTKNVLMISDGTYVYNSVDNGKDEINSELFQICFKKGAFDYNMIQSSNAVFIVSKNSIRKIPLYDSISSSSYGCGYYTDTTPNKWLGAAPYYFASNVLNNERRSKYNRDVFISFFKENFKVELEKLLKHIPDAFVDYTKNRLVEELKKSGIEVEGDDGQIADLLINSVASTTANSLGMYVHDKFMEKIGDDTTYQTFANNVYQACIADNTNNMTKDFYDIFEELYYSTVIEAISELNYGPEGISAFLLRYYQNHKAEWAKSMTDLIDVDIVDPDIYEVPLKTTQTLKETTYRFNYNTGEYEFQYIISPNDDYEVIEGYLRDNDFWTEESGGSMIDHRTTDYRKTYYAIDGNIICYKNPDDNRYYAERLQDYTLSEDTTPVTGKTYYRKTDEAYAYSPTTDTTPQETEYYTPNYSLTEDTFAVSGKTYYEKTGGQGDYKPAESVPGETYLEPGTYFEKTDYQKAETFNENTEYYEQSYLQFIGEAEDDVQYYKREYELTADVELDPNKVYYERLDLSVFDGDSYYKPYQAGDTGTRYSLNYVEVSSTELDDTQTYFTREVTEVVNNPSEAGWYEIQNGEFVPTTDTSLVSGKTYYVNCYARVNEPTGNPSEQHWYELVDGAYIPTSDTTVFSNKTYYAEVYSQVDNPTGNPASQHWYEIVNGEFVLTADTAIVSGKTYYTRTLAEMEVNFNPAEERWYEIQDDEYVRTNDTSIVPGKTYYIIEYIVVETLDEQEGPYYYVDGFVADNRGDYVDARFSGETYSYNQVQYPQLNNLSTYYEAVYVKTKVTGTIVESNDIFILDYIPVESPEEIDLDSYYEKRTEYRIADDVNYVYSSEGDIIGIVFDRNYYVLENENEEYTEKVPVSNPHNEGLYEITSYSQIIQGSSLNPHDEGLYVLTYSATSFIPVIVVNNPHDEGLYECSTTYSRLYDDGKVYIDLGAVSQSVDFAEEDDNWHNAFYDEVLAAKEEVTDKASALAKLDDIALPYPSWKWQSLINESVTTLYIPTQGEQFRAIVMDSNMYPIQWHELPSNIDRKSFDYALTTLLYMIKQRLLTNITILVDGGKVKCYSCVDASTVIRRIVNRNYMVWKNQIKIAKNKINKASTLDEIKTAFNMVHAFDLTLDLLEKILNDQSRLYAKYIDMLIEEQVINDNETEVTL